MRGIPSGTRAATPNPSEDREQRALAQYLDRLKLRWCHVPNGGARDRISGSILRGHGVKPGVPDVLIFDVAPLQPQARGVAIELKRQKGGKVSKVQEEWLEGLAALGWLVHVAKGWRDAAGWLRDQCGWGR